MLQTVVDLVISNSQVTFFFNFLLSFFIYYLVYLLRLSFVVADKKITFTPLFEYVVTSKYNVFGRFDTVNKGLIFISRIGF